MTPDPAVAQVLVVDDNAENRALAQAALDDDDVPVVLAATGEEAIAAFRRSPPDCILLDIRMPGLDGISVCERIRSLPGGDRVAIVFVTAQRDVETFDRALRAGGDDFITKPFRPSDLLVRIHTAMRLRRMVSERGVLSVELKQQRDELQRLQLHKEQLSAFLVHDLKNPVNNIELLVQRVLRNPGADERSRDAATRIQSETRGLLRMITNLLDIGKADEGQLAPRRLALDAVALVHGVLDELRIAAAAAEIELVARVEPVQLRADRDLMHRVLANLFVDRGVRIDRTYQLNFGGNMDFMNMLERTRLVSKKISKTQSVTSQVPHEMAKSDVHIGPSDHVPWLDDRKWAYIRLEGRAFGDVPLSAELKLEVWDSPNSAGVIIDAIRAAKIGLDRGLAGPIMSASSYFMKSPPVQYSDHDAHQAVEGFIAGTVES